MTADFLPSGGTSVVFEWLRELARPTPGMRVWTDLDDDLRLAFVQGWMIEQGYDLVADRDQAAVELADVAGSDELFSEMFADLVAHLKSVYEDIDGRPGLVDVTDVVGVDMELVVFASEDLAGEYDEGAELPVHCFIVKLVGDRWKIAANSRRLPIPGWPPTEMAVSGLVTEEGPEKSGGDPPT